MVFLGCKIIKLLDFVYSILINSKNLYLWNFRLNVYEYLLGL